MNKKLPTVYAVPITKKIENNKETFKSFERGEVNNANKVNKVSIDEINKIFNSKTHVYKTRVILGTTKGNREVDIVGMAKNSLLTLTGEMINIDDILSIKKV